MLGVPYFPVSPVDCALYLLYLLESSKSTSAINCAFYAFKRPHQIARVDSPTLHPTVVSVKEGALRLVSQPASQGKEPLEVIHLKQLAEKTDFDNLLQLRSLVMFILAFPFFFRSSELCLIRSRHVHFSLDCKSKTDQLERVDLLSLLKLSLLKLVRLHAYRDSFKKYFLDIVPDFSKFNTHSTRLGGATLATNSGLSERNIQRHGRWASVEAKIIYVKDDSLSSSRFEIS